MNDNKKVPQYELLIDGKWVTPESGQYSTILNPATEEVIAHVAAGSEKDVDTAAKAARAALKVWNGITAAERGRILNRLADLLEKNQEELIMLESMNAGKPIASVRRQDMPAAIDTLRYYAGWTDKIIGQVIPARTDALTYTVREPVGVVGAIVPWNFPLMIGIWKIAPALACGCTLVVKPAELTPMTAIRIGELALEAGIPPGVLNIVTGKGSVVGDAMVAHPQIDKITFTGSPKVGRGIMQGAAVNFKKITLELGGKSANIIFDDADLDSAVRGSASGIFFNAGQVCSAGSRILVHKKIHDEVVDRLIERAKHIRIGDTASDDTIMGPLVSRNQMNTVMDYIDIGKKEGACVAYGGQRVGDKGFYVSPTIFTDVQHEMRISQEEIFGPVASIIPFEDEEDAIRIANGTAFSLAAGIWSADVTRIHKVAHELRAGTVWINTYGYTDVRLPWGGTGESGFGREHGEAALENFTEPKTIWLSLLKR
ncbi:aldehyde dehydrogenase family protein [Oxalobacter sp. OxGP1]|uniref:aldehyde dehydrogenase family protein n=1 Tax=Oxalobacter paeniformigenes TaxID=2946594 RepID=UPI0022AE57FE|nr:aldehyde dehydrogenase family protein [Oxalobacter paeniformigenes]MCZ4053769.1 aldehyde dehydrogenase family protein [Oxalobacter paeniformigenes]